MQIRTIAFFTGSYPMGGVQTVTRHLGRFFHDRGYRVMLYTPQLTTHLLTAQERETFVFEQLPEYNTKHPANVDYLCRSLLEEKVSHLIIQQQVDFPFDAVRRQTEVRLIFCLHSLPLWEREMLRNRSCTELHNPTFARKLELIFLRKPVYYLTPKLKNRYLKLYADILSRVDRFVTLCPQYSRQMQLLIRNSGFPGSDAPDAKYVSIINPLPPVRDEFDTPKDKMVLYVGRLRNAVKRVDRLLKIWRTVVRSHPEWRLIIVGTGIAEERLKRMVAKYDREGKHIEFAGYHHDVTPFYRRARFVCLTSNYEGLPMSLMEGQQYGAIPVSFDSFDGIREITRDGTCGIMIPAFDLRKYAEKLGAALGDEALQRKLSEASRAAARRYDVDVIGQQWLRLFEEL